MDPVDKEVISETEAVDKEVISEIDCEDDDVDFCDVCINVIACCTCHCRYRE